MNLPKPKAIGSRLTIKRRLTIADPALGRLIAAVVARIGTQRIVPSRSSVFGALVRAIIHQSVSGKAAASIFTRFKEIVGQPFAPSTIMARRPQTLMRAGLSTAKVRAIRSLAEWFASNPKLAQALPRLADTEVVKILGAIPGIGTWTVNVFLIFNLGRLDVMPTADLGIRRGVQLIGGSRSAPTAKQVAERSQVWSPYRSIASIYLWQAGKLKLSPKDLNAGGKR